MSDKETFGVVVRGIGVVVILNGGFQLWMLTHDYGSPRIIFLTHSYRMRPIC